MTTNYTGDASAVPNDRSNVTVPIPVDSDAPNAATFNGAFQPIINHLQDLRQRAGFLDLVSSWPSRQDFTGGVKLYSTCTMENLGTLTFNSGSTLTMANGSTLQLNNSPTFGAGATLANSTFLTTGNSNFSCNATSEFAYDPVRSEFEHIAGLGCDWQYGGSAPTVTTGSAVVYVDGANAYIGNNTAGGYYVARARLPKGAVVTSLEFALMNNHASAIAVVGLSMNLLTRRAAGVGGFTELYDGAVVFNGDVNVPAVTTTAVWTAATPITSQTMPSDGWARVGCYFKTTNGATAVDGNVRCYGVRIGYTINKVSRTG
jgi:uncharacterized membrane protein YgdD (TMEM256/DUF423 family)